MCGHRWTIAFPSMLKQQSETLKFYGLTYVVVVLAVPFHINNNLFTQILFSPVLKSDVFYVQHYHRRKLFPRGQELSEFSHKHHSSISFLVETAAFSNSHPPGSCSVAPL